MYQHLNTHVHRRISHGSQKVETIQVSLIDEVKKNVVYKQWNIIQPFKKYGGLEKSS